MASLDAQPCGNRGSIALGKPPRRVFPQTPFPKRARRGPNQSAPAPRRLTDRDQLVDQVFGQDEDPHVGSDGRRYARKLRVSTCHRCKTKGRHTFRTKRPDGPNGRVLLKLVAICPSCAKEVGL